MTLPIKSSVTTQYSQNYEVMGESDIKGYNTLRQLGVFMCGGNPERVNVGLEILHLAASDDRKDIRYLMHEIHDSDSCDVWSAHFHIHLFERKTLFNGVRSQSMMNNVRPFSPVWHLRSSPESVRSFPATRIFHGAKGMPMYVVEHTRENYLL